MSKDKISQYSSTSAGANLNTDIAGINIDEGCPPSGINNAIRALMSQIKDLQTGVSGDTIPIAAGGTGSSTDASARAALGLGSLAIKSTIDTSDITAGAVTTAKIAADAVDGTKIAADAIDGTKIADGAINSEHITANAVGATQLNVSGNGTSGQVLSSDGDGSMTWIDSGGGGFAFTSADAVTQSGTWTSPANTTLIRVTCIGGGAGRGTPLRTGGSGGTSAANFGTGKNITSPGGVGGFASSDPALAPAAAWQQYSDITGALAVIEPPAIDTKNRGMTMGLYGSFAFGGAVNSFSGQKGVAIYEVTASTGYPITVGGGGGYGGGNTNGNPGGTSGMAGGTFNGNSANGGNGTAGGGGAPGTPTGGTYNALNNAKFYAGPGYDGQSGSGGIVIIEY